MAVGVEGWWSSGSRRALNGWRKCDELCSGDVEQEELLSGDDRLAVLPLPRPMAESAA